MIRAVTEKDFDKIVTLSEYAFQYSIAENEQNDAKEKLKKQYIIGDFEADELKAKLHIYNLMVRIKKQSFKMGGVASVATWPEARRSQKVAKLIKEGLQYMNAQEYDISYLHPFYVPFYRKYGWEIICSEKTYTIPQKDLLFLQSQNGRIIRRTKDDALPLLMKLYNEFTESLIVC